MPRPLPSSVISSPWGPLALVGMIAFAVSGVPLRDMLALANHGGPRGRRPETRTPMKCPYCGFLNDRVVDSREGKDHQVVRGGGNASPAATVLPPMNRRRTSSISPSSAPGSGSSLIGNKNHVGADDGRRTSGRSRRGSWTLSWTTWSGSSTPGGARNHHRSHRAHRHGALEVPDRVAYVRFASVHRHFEDVDAFMEEVKNLLHQR